MAATSCSRVLPLDNKRAKIFLLGLLDWKEASDVFPSSSSLRFTKHQSNGLLD